MSLSLSLYIYIYILYVEPLDWLDLATVLSNDGALA